MSIISKVRLMEPAALQLMAIKVFAVIGIVLTLVTGIYLYGRHDGKLACQAAINKVAVATAETRARNAIGASQRFSEYILNDRELDTWAIEAKSSIAEYYAMQPKPKTKVVYKPGSKEYVNVPIFDCGTGVDVVFDAGELQLYNWGNKRSDLNTPNPQPVPGVVQPGTAGTNTPSY